MRPAPVVGVREERECTVPQRTPTTGGVLPTTGGREVGGGEGQASGPSARVGAEPGPGVPSGSPRFCSHVSRFPLPGPRLPSLDTCTHQLTRGLDILRVPQMEEEAAHRAALQAEQSAAAMDSGDLHATHTLVFTRSEASAQRPHPARHNPPPPPPPPRGAPNLVRRLMAADLP